MADDDQALTLGGRGPYPESAEAAPSEPAPKAEPPSEQAKPDEAPPGSEADYQHRMANLQAIQEHLLTQHKEAYERQGRMLAKLTEEANNIRSLVGRPATGPPQGAVSAPPPMSEQQKGGLSEFVVNVLKWGGLLTLAFGAGGRSPGHSFLWKSAIGSALKGYAAGRKDVVDASLRVWEKNREVINDANKEQMANYRALLADERLQLGQKMDLFRSMATVYGDTRTYEASERQSLLDVQKNLDDQAKLLKDWQAETRRQRPKLYASLGKPHIFPEYIAWVQQKSGVQITADWDNDQFEEFEAKHPDLRWSEFLKWHEQEAIRQAGEKSKAEAAGRKAGAEGEVPTTEEEQKKKDAAQKKVDEIKAKILPGL